MKKFEVLASILFWLVVGAGAQANGVPYSTNAPANGESGLQSIDRTIHREPAYRTKSPQYALLIFGPKAQTRVWLVLDRDLLYVDRNGNGDLTDDGPPIHPTLNAALESTYEIGTLTEADGRTIDTNFKLRISPVDAGAPWCMISGRVGRRYVQYAYCRTMFAASPQKAKGFHFNGPLTMGFKDWINGNTIRIRVGTPGWGEDTFVSLDYSVVPETAYPTVEVEYLSTLPGAASVHRTVSLRGRC